MQKFRGRAEGIEIGWRYAEIGPAARNVGQQRQNPPIQSSAALHGVARSRVAHLSSPRRKTHFIFLSVPKCYRRRRRRDATTLPLHRSLCTRTCHQFPRRRRRRRYHISAAVKARPPSLPRPLPLSVSLPTAPLWRVFENVSFLRRELFSFLGVTRSRVTAGGSGGGGGGGRRG